MLEFHYFNYCEIHCSEFSLFLLNYLSLSELGKNVFEWLIVDVLLSLQPSRQSQGHFVT